MRSIEPGISRSRVWSFGPSRNDRDLAFVQAEGLCRKLQIVPRRPIGQCASMTYDPFLVLIAAVFALAGFIKGVIGLGLPTVSMGLLAVAMPPSVAINIT